MSPVLIAAWAACRAEGAQLLKWDDVPPRHRVERASCAVHRCVAALPRSNILGRCFFVQCGNGARASWCHVHAGGVRHVMPRKHRPKAAGEAATP